MADQARPGTFWCSECSGEIPEPLREKHLASHEEQRAEEPDAAIKLIFWGLCIAAAVALALLFSATR